MNKVLSFDVSSVSTGWAYFEDGKLKKFGLITRNSIKDYSTCQKLLIFKKDVEQLLTKYKPSVVIIEETYMKNVKTLKMLSQLIGILQIGSYLFLSVEPIFISPNTVRSYFEVKKKEDAYKYVVNRYKSKFKNSTFEKDNDITDSILQGLYFLEKEKSNE